MAAVVLQIADEVVDALNGASLSQAFTAERLYVPVRDLSTELRAGLNVLVVPRSLAFVTLSRRDEDFTYVIDVCVAQKLPDDAVSAADVAAFCDPLMALVEEMLDVFRGGFITVAAGRAQCFAAENLPIFGPDTLDQMRVFASVLSITFKMMRAH